MIPKNIFVRRKFSFHTLELPIKMSRVSLCTPFTSANKISEKRKEEKLSFASLDCLQRNV